MGKFRHPQSTIVGLRLVLKFGLNPTYSFGDIAIFIFCRIGLKLPTHAHFAPVTLRPRRPHHIDMWT